MLTYPGDGVGVQATRHNPASPRGTRLPHLKASWTDSRGREDWRPVSSALVTWRQRERRLPWSHATQQSE